MSGRHPDSRSQGQRQQAADGQRPQTLQQDDQRQAEEVAQGGERSEPDQQRWQRSHHEPSQAHLGSAGHEGGVGTNARHQASDRDAQGTGSLEAVMGALVLLVGAELVRQGSESGRTQPSCPAITGHHAGGHRGHRGGEKNQRCESSAGDQESGHHQDDLIGRDRQRHPRFVDEKQGADDHRCSNPVQASGDAHRAIESPGTVARQPCGSSRRASQGTAAATRSRAAGRRHRFGAIGARRAPHLAARRFDGRCDARGTGPA